MIHEIYKQLTNRLLVECRKFYGDRLVTVCVFGSVGRDTVNPESDIDVLIVARALPDGRMRRIREFQSIESRLKADIQAARKRGVFVEISPVIKSSEEVSQGSPLFLDMIDDGRLLYDKNGFFKEHLEAFKHRLLAQGAHRVHRGDSWYWVLKEPYTPGEEIRL